MPEARSAEEMFRNFFREKCLTTGALRVARFVNTLDLVPHVARLSDKPEFCFSACAECIFGGSWGPRHRTTSLQSTVKARRQAILCIQREAE